jgi:methionyl-tRNA formyltransferase
MKILLLCATQRGLAVLKKLTELQPKCELTVCSFREEDCEPPFLDAIRECTLARHGSFFESRHFGSGLLNVFQEDSAVDLMLVVSWRYLIPAQVYKRARLGAFVFHDSLLPAYRGFAPTVWAMVNGETHTGATLFEIAEDVDMGDIIGQQHVPIGSEETIATVMDRVTLAYLRLLEQNLTTLLANSAPRRPQDHSGASYTCRRLPADNQIDWFAPTRSTFNLIRAVTEPYPGAYTWLKGTKLRIWKAALLAADRNYVGRVPGRVVEVLPGTGAVVLTKDGTILIKEVQMEQGQRVCAAEVLNSLSMTLGH